MDASKQAVHLLAVGAANALGMSARAATAAFCARLSQVRAHPFIVDRFGQSPAVALASAIPSQQRYRERIAALLDFALHDLCSDPQLASCQSVETPALLSLPHWNAKLTQHAAGEALAQPPEPLKISVVRAIAGDNAAGLRALGQAAAAINAGEAECQLVGAVDCFIDAARLEWLDAHGQLFGERNRWGVIPGEGAAFVLIGSEAYRRRMAWRSLGVVCAHAHGVEPNRQGVGVCTGQALTAVIQACLDGADSSPVDDVVIDLDTSRYRAEEYGFAALRLGERLRRPAAFVAPHDVWGQLGAATGITFAALATTLAARGRGGFGPKVLLACGSASGQRAASVLDYRDCGGMS